MKSDCEKNGAPSYVVGEIELMVDQGIHRVFEGAGKELPLQINGEKPGAGVDVFVARHLLLQNIVLRFDLDIYFGSRHDAVMKILFLQPR